MSSLPKNILFEEKIKEINLAFQRLKLSIEHKRSLINLCNEYNITQRFSGNVYNNKAELFDKIFSLIEKEQNSISGDIFELNRSLGYL